MIHIYKPSGKLVRIFENNTEFFNHISAGELLEDHPEIDTSQWSFVIFPSEWVSNLYFKLKQKPAPPQLKEAYEQQLGVIEICKGGYANPTWVPITFDLNMGGCKKDWYLECCRAHGYVVTENGEANIFNRGECGL